MTAPTTAIIGSGIAGLACARRLADAGMPVTLFDKGRKPGGRLATREVRHERGPLAWDHGAPAFQVTAPDFAAFLKPALDAGVAEIGADGTCRPLSGINAVPTVLAGGFDLHQGVEVVRIEAVRIEAGGSAWALRTDDGSVLGVFDRVVVGVPAPQAEPLLRPLAPALAGEAAAAGYDPIWAGLFALDLAVGPATRTVHADVAWTRANLERDRADVAADLERLLVADGPVFHRTAHRWRYARVAKGVGSSFGWDAALNLGTIGDWRLGPDVEDAWRSGEALGRRLSRA